VKVKLLRVLDVCRGESHTWKKTYILLFMLDIFVFFSALSALIAIVVLVVKCIS